MTDVYSAISSILMVAVMGFYLEQVVKGVSTPNPATWAIWFITTIMNTFTYYYVVEGDIIKFLMTAIVASGVSLIFIYSLFRGKFTKPGSTEIICFGLALVVGTFWRTTGNDIATNLLLQGIFVISFYPTINGLLRNQAKERPLPWTLATVSYTFLALALITDWEKGGWIALVHPILVGICGNGTVALLAYRLRF